MFRYVLFISVVLPTLSHGATYEDELKVREVLFVNYSNAIRPVKSLHDEVHVNFTFEILNIEEMNIKSQTLTVTLMTIMKWKDEKLVWDPTAYNGADSFHVHPGDKKDVWRPDVSAFNTIDQFVELGNNHNPLHIKSDGTVVMESGVVLATHCEVDVTYYPFDTQVCEVIIGAFVYDTHELNITIDRIRTDNFRVNGEWALVSIVGERHDKIFDVLPQAVLDFKITVKRRRPFFLLYLILPLIMLGFLNPVVFLLPAASGEKMSLSITVLLTYAVFLTVISEHVPSTSQHVPVLAFYVFMTFLISCVCVWISIILLKFYNKPEDERVPTWLKKLTCGKLAKILRIERDCPRCQAKIERQARTNSVAPTENGNVSEPELKLDVSEHQINWQGVVEILDNFNFWVFFIITLVVFIVCFSIIFSH